MKVAFLANSFHLTKTGSADFFIDFLRESFGDPVVVPHKEAWQRLPGRRWDLLVSWQKHYDPRELEAFPADRVVVVPMYDDTRFDAVYWRGYHRFKIICFSSNLEDRLRQHGLLLHGARFYPAPRARTVPRVSAEGLRGFFWPRGSSLSWEIVKRLIGQSDLARMQLHWTPTIHDDVPDPDRSVPPNIRELKVSSWLGDRQEYASCLAQANVFFASRRLEGIGMSFLEAMALGMCVVAPDSPTMNEYIRTGENGLLYDPDNLKPVDFSRAEELGAAAKATVADGRANWEKALPALRKFLEEPVSGYRHRWHPVIELRGRSIVAARSVYRRLKRRGIGTAGT